MVITMFKSVIDSSPILFVKVGQEQVGAVDFMLVADSGTSMLNADVNPYDIDMFQNDFLVQRDN